MRPITLAAASLLALAAPSLAGVAAGRSVGKVTVCGAGGCLPLYEGRPLDPEDVVSTADESRCDLEADGGGLRALADSKVRLDDGSAHSCAFTLFAGSVLAAWPSGQCSISTVQASAGGAGARFRIALEDGLAHVSVLERGVRIVARARPVTMRKRWWAGKVPAAVSIPSAAVAAVVALKGSARVAAGEASEPAKVGTALARGEELRTDGLAAVAFADGTLVVLDRGARLAVEPRGADWIIALRGGRVYVRRSSADGARALVTVGGASAEGDSEEFEAAASEGALSDFVVYSGSLFVTAAPAGRAAVSSSRGS